MFDNFDIKSFLISLFKVILNSIMKILSYKSQCK